MTRTYSARRWCLITGRLAAPDPAFTARIARAWYDGLDRSVGSDGSVRMTVELTEREDGLIESVVARLRYEGRWPEEAG